MSQHKFAYTHTYIRVHVNTMTLPASRWQQHRRAACNKPERDGEEEEGDRVDLKEEQTQQTRFISTKNSKLQGKAYIHRAPTDACEIPETLRYVCWDFEEYTVCLTMSRRTDQHDAKVSRSCLSLEAETDGKV